MCDTETKVESSCELRLRLEYGISSVMKGPAHTVVSRWPRGYLATCTRQAVWHVAGMVRGPCARAVPWPLLRQRAGGLQTPRGWSSQSWHRAPTCCRTADHPMSGCGFILGSKFYEKPIKRGADFFIEKGSGRNAQKSLQLRKGSLPVRGTAECWGRWGGFGGV